MSKTEIRYQKNGKETILKGWIADCFLISLKKTKVLKEYYEITGFDFFVIKRKKFQTMRTMMNQEFVIAKDTFFCLEDCSFEDISRVKLYGDKISLKRISSANYNCMSVEVKQSQDTEIILKSNPNTIIYNIDGDDGKVRISGDGSTSSLFMNKVSNLQVHDVQNLYFHMFDRWIKEIEIAHSNVSLWNFQDAKVTIQDSKVFVSEISKKSELILNHSKMIIDHAYFMKNNQNVTLYDKDGILYINDDSILKSQMCFVSVLKALQNKLETQLSLKQESIIKKKRKELKKVLQEKDEQIEMLKEEQKELLNDLDKASDHIHLSLTNKKIKEIE